MKHDDELEAAGEINPLNRIPRQRSQTGDSNMYTYIKRVKSRNKIYQYLVVECYLGNGKRKKLLHIPIKKILEDYLNEELKSEKVSWCGGWDSNPRRPTPTGLEPAPFMKGDGSRGALGNHLDPGFLKQTVGKPFSQKLQSEFREWCLKSASEKTCEGYLKRLKEIDSREKPIDHSRWHITAYKKLMRYLCEEKGVKKACEEFKKVKSRKSETDLWVPTDAEMFETLEKACSESIDLCWFYKLLLYTGLRAVEVEHALARGEWVNEDGIWLQTLQLYRGSKKAFLAFSVEKPPKLKVSADWVSHKAYRLRLIPPKYVRKYVSTKMTALGIQEIVLDFIQGRTPTTVLRQRYVYLREIAKQEYKKYAQWLRNRLDLLSKTNFPVLSRLNLVYE